MLRWRKRNEKWVPRTPAPGFVSPCVSWLQVSDLPYGEVCALAWRLLGSWDQGLLVTSSTGAHPLSPVVKDVGLR